MIYLLQIRITNATLPDPSSGHRCGSLFTQLAEQEDIVQMQQEVLLLLNICGLLCECSNCCWWFNIHLWRFAGGKLIFVHSNLQFSCIVLWIWYPVFPMFCYRDLLLCFYLWSEMQIDQELSIYHWVLTLLGHHASFILPESSCSFYLESIQIK
jgi:hypothetical protein